MLLHNRAKFANFSISDALLSVYARGDRVDAGIDPPQSRRQHLVSLPDIREFTPLGW